VGLSFCHWAGIRVLVERAVRIAHAIQLICNPYHQDAAIEAIERVNRILHGALSEVSENPVRLS
jgi:hypothetical protein